MRHSANNSGQHNSPRTPGESEQVLGDGMTDADAVASILTEDGELAIDGGKLPGNHDDFNNEEVGGVKQVPGANGAGEKVNVRDLPQGGHG